MLPIIARALSKEIKEIRLKIVVWIDIGVRILYNTAFEQIYKQIALCTDRAAVQSPQLESQSSLESLVLVSKRHLNTNLLKFKWSP